MLVAYHGCDAEVAELILRGARFRPSQNDYDCLGEGVYFWEYGADRALQFARKQQHRGKVTSPDRRRRYLKGLQENGKPYDTVRCGFTEGPPAYEGGGIQCQTHVQIAVRNPACILGVFRPTMETR